MQTKWGRVWEGCPQGKTDREVAEDRGSSRKSKAKCKQSRRCSKREGGVEKKVRIGAGQTGSKFSL